MTLAATWLRVETEIHGLTKVEAIRRLNEATGVRTTKGDANRWERGERYPQNPAVRRYMLAAVLRERGLTGKRLRDEVEAFA